MGVESADSAPHLPSEGKGKYMPEKKLTQSVQVISVEEGPMRDGVEAVNLETSHGRIECRFHPGEPGEAAVLWVGGVGGGFDMPAGGLYARMAEVLGRESIASLRLGLRRAGHLYDSILDAFHGIEFLLMQGRSRIALVGHSFGAAVVINAGAMHEKVVAVAGLATQSYGTSLVSNLSPRPLLLLHGAKDSVLPEACSFDVYHRAHEPKAIKSYPQCGHAFEECPDEVEHDLLTWLREILAVSVLSD